MPTTSFLWMFYLVALAQVAITVRITRMELRRENPFVLFWVALLLVYVIPSLGDPFVDDARTNEFARSIDLVNNFTLIKAQLFYAAMSVIYLFVRSTWSEPILAGTTNSLLLKSRSLRLSSMEAAAILTITAVAALSALASIGFSFERFLAGSYTSFRLEADTPLKLVSYYLAIAGGGAAFLFWLQGRRLLSATVIVFIVVVFLAGRTRQVLIPLLFPAAFFMLLRMRGALGWLRVGAVGIGLFALFAVLQFFRYVPSLQEGVGLLASGALLDEFLPRLASSQGEAALRFAYYFWFEHGDFPGFSEGLTYLRLLLFWLPTSLSSGLKPRDFDEVLYANYYWLDTEAIAGSLHVLFPGSAYTNFGWLGVFLGVALALFARAIGRWLHKIRPERAVLLLGPACYMTLMIARGSIYNTLVMFMVSCTLIWLVFRFSSVVAIAAQPEGGIVNAPD